MTRNSRGGLLLLTACLGLALLPTAGTAAVGAGGAAADHAGATVSATPECERAKRLARRSKRALRRAKAALAKAKKAKAKRATRRARKRVARARKRNAARQRARKRACAQSAPPVTDTPPPSATAPTPNSSPLPPPPPEPPPPPPPEPPPPPPPEPEPEPEPEPVNQAPEFPSPLQSSVLTQFQYDGVGRLTGALTTIEVLSPAVDPDGDPVTYSWSATNGSITGDGLVGSWARFISFGFPADGDAVITAVDGRGGSDTFTFQFR